MCDEKPVGNRRTSRLATLCAVVCASCCIPAFSFAAALAVQVVGPDQEPVANAVVTLDGKDGEPAAAVSDTTEMDQRDRNFHPHMLAVSTGTTLFLPNNDTVQHHVYSFSSAAHFELKLYPRGETRQVRLDRPGIVAIGCNIHDWMRSYVLVTDAPWHAVTDGSGLIRFDDLPAGEYTLAVWYPGLGRDMDSAIVRQLELADGQPVSLTVRGPVRALPDPALSHRPQGGFYD